MLWTSRARPAQTVTKLLWTSRARLSGIGTALYCSGREALVCGLDCVPSTRWQHLLDELVFSCGKARFLYENMACGGADPCIAGPSTRKRSCSFSSSSSSDADSDTDVYLVSGSEDSDDGELSSSSGDDEDSGEANIASAREWILLYVDNPPVKAHRFPFLAIPGKTFILSSPGDIMEYIQQFLDDELI